MGLDSSSGEGTILSDFTQTSTGPGTGVQTLKSFTLNPGLLVRNGQLLKLYISGDFVNSGNDKFLAVTFGSTPIFFTIDPINLAASFTITLVIGRRSNNEQVIIGDISVRDVPNIPYNFVATEDLSQQLTITVTGQDLVDSPGDITLNSFLIDFKQDA